MAINDFIEIKNVVKKYGLKPASQRGLPLLTLSFISQGYTSLLREALGFSYEAIAALGGEGKFYTMLNEGHVAKETGFFVEKTNKKIYELAFKKSKNIFRHTSSRLKEIKKYEAIKNPKKCLQQIIQLYPNYMLSIGIYNCFWRYLGNDSSKGQLSASAVKIISTDREKIAKLYPQIEKKLEELCKIIGEKLNFDGDILRYFTYTEINNFFLNKNLERLDEEIIKTLELRRKKYFYLCVEGKKEQIILDNIIIDKIEKKFFPIDNSVKEIKGFMAFKGNAKGKVFNLQNHISTDSEEFKGGNILVTSMTHPKDIMLIKKSGAIVTDEGGILSHAAILSRELKKPCIIGTRIATQILKDGDLVEVDADKGIVKIIK